jgi:hypothetical protein
MELQEFIKNTLVQITNGVIDAQNELKDTGCLINPMSYTTAVDKNMIIKGVQNTARMIQTIKMNVVLDVSKSNNSKSGIGVAKVIKAGIESDETTINKNVTSIEFEIPVAFPVMENI